MEQEVCDYHAFSLSLPLGSRGLANSFVEGGVGGFIIVMLKLCMCTIYTCIDLSAFPRNFTYTHNRVGFKKNLRICG